jgi:hypothetical protein
MIAGKPLSGIDIDSVESLFWELLFGELLFGSLNVRVAPEQR